MKKENRSKTRIAESKKRKAATKSYFSKLGSNSLGSSKPYKFGF